MGTVKNITALLLVCLLANTVNAQELIKGKVIDSETKEPLAGAHVIITGTTQGTITGHNGNFEFESTITADSISVSFVGYHSKTIAWENETIITLQSAATELDQVVVTASRDRQKRTDAPIAISVVSPKTISETKPTTPREVLNKVGGVYMVDLGNEQHSMSMRQPLTTASMFLYLEDGIPIRPTGLFNHNALIEMNMAGTARMEVIKGPSSSLHGSEAIGGAINFIMHSPSPEPKADIQMQSSNTGYKKTDFVVSDSWQNVGLVASGYYANRSDGPYDHSDYDKLALTLRGDWHITDQTVWTNTLTYIDYKTDMTGGVDSTNFFQQDFTSLQTFTYRKVDALRYRSSLNLFWNETSKTTITGIFRDNEMGQNPHYRIKDDYKPWAGTGDPSLAHGEENISSFQSGAGIIQHREKVEFMETEWITGLSFDYSPSSYQANYIRIEKNEQGIYADYAKTDSLLSYYDVDLMNTAVYTHLKIAPTDRLNIIAALRYDRMDYDYDNHLTPSAFSGAPDETNHFDQVTPKVGFTYDIKANIGFYGNYSVGFSPPDVSELYRGVKVPRLEPSIYSNYEIGGWFSFANGKGYMDLALYQLDGEDEIISVKQPDGSTEKENAGETRHRGIEYSVKYAPANRLSIRFSGANAEHLFIDFVEEGNDYSNNLMATSPSFIANSEMVYRPGFLKGSHISLEWQHMGEYYMDPANTEKYPGFDVFNLRFGYQVNNAEFWVHTLNIMDENYATVVNKSAWGKSYRVGQPRTITVGIGFNF